MRSATGGGDAWGVAAGRAEAVAAEWPRWPRVAVAFPDGALRDERRAYARAAVNEATQAYLDDVGLLDETTQERPAVRTLDRFAASLPAAAGIWA